MAAKGKTLVQLKPIPARNAEKKNTSLIKRNPTTLLNNQQQQQQQQQKLQPVKPVIPNTSEFNRLITGDFTQGFSKQTSRHFRIFISSTFSDFKVERNELYRRVFPPIKQRCAELGYEFQIVDMRWGVSDTADSDHTADVMCMDEIDRCIDLSAGLNFIYLVGNRYGFMYVPTEIDEDEFDTLLEVAYEYNIDNIDLLKKWFQLDKNSLPPKYVYLPITTHFTHFEVPSAEQQQEKKQWQEEERTLLTALRNSVDKAAQKGKISNEQAQKYFQSITEREIRRAMTEQNRSNVIGVCRDFSNPFTETSIDAKFFDAMKNERIKNSISQLKAYCTKATPAKQFKNFVVPWKSGGLNIEEDSAHLEYIDGFCKFLTTTIMDLIENTCRHMASRTLSTFHEDLLHHGIFAQEKTNFFFGREELLSSVHTRIETNRRNVSSPIAFVADSGSGKTSFMARLAKELHVWYPTSAVFMRFLGTSAATTNIESVIRSLCTQLKILYGDNRSSDDSHDGQNEDDDSITFSSLVRIFHDRLKSVSRKHINLRQKKSRPKPVFILLDAIDQLADTSKYGFQFDLWLLRYLPRDVHIFVSFIPIVEHYNLKDSFLQFMRNDESALVTVPRLRRVDCEDIIRSSLQTYHRQLTLEQYTYLLATVEQNPKPLYLKLLINIARRWTCYPTKSLQSSLSLPETIEEAIEQLFARLENRHGKEFVQYSLAYLVYGLNGISESELEDCLSINDIVLNEIYSHHDPPIPNAIHVPSLICQSFLYSINEYLSRKRIHDKHVVSFYHRKFYEATRKRYDHLSKQCHEHLIDIYCHNKTSYQRTIVLQKRNNKIINDADRLINTQLTSILNKRKLIALPYHCLEIGTEKDHLLRSVCLFDLKFLSCQLQSLGHTLFLDSIRNCLRLRPNWFDLKRLYQAIWSVDDQTIVETNAALVLAEQILGFIDNHQTSQLYDDSHRSNKNDDIERLLLDCRKCCDQNENSVRSLYAGFPQETDELAWSFSPASHVLFLSEFYCLVALGGVIEEEEPNFIRTSTVAMINIQTGKVDQIRLNEEFNRIWNGYVTKNGNKIYLFGASVVQTFNSRTGDMLNERPISWDRKSFCNKAYCLASNEERLVLANELRVIALNEVDEDDIYRSGRIPLKNQSFHVENSANVKVCLRCTGTNDEHVLCLVFDEHDQVLITQWSLNEHDEMLPMRIAFIHYHQTSMHLFDISMSNDEILYLADVNGELRTLDLLKIKPRTRVQPLSIEDGIQQMTVLQNQTLSRLVCLSDGIIALSTMEYIALFQEKDMSTILHKIIFNATLFSWNMITQDNHRHLLITVDASQQFIMIYRQENDSLTSLKPMKIEFRSNVNHTQLIQTTTIMDNDDKKQPYILILLNDQTIQLLDADQVSQSSLQPKGLFTRIASYTTNDSSVSACEYDLNCPLVISSLSNQSHSPQLLNSFKEMKVEYIAMLNNDQYFVLVTNGGIAHIFSVQMLTQSLFQYNLKPKSPTNLFSIQTFNINKIIFMFIDRFLVLQVKFYSLENKFKTHSEQFYTIPNRQVAYSLELTPNKNFLILSQSLSIETNPSLRDIRIFTCDNDFKISQMAEPIAYIKSKLSVSGKINSFIDCVALNTRSELRVTYQGSILRVQLPSNIAELEICSDYHCWMRHSLAVYQKTTQKTSLSITITSIAIQSPNDSHIASGANDGSIVVWYLANKHFHEVLESIHTDEITALKFDSNTNRLFSSSSDRQLAIWSPSKLLHVLNVHMPIDTITPFPFCNIILARGKFWGFDRLMMFHIGNYSQQSTSQLQKNMNRGVNNDTDIQASDVASWAL